MPEHGRRLPGEHGACERAMPKSTQRIDDRSQQVRADSAALFHPRNENPVQMRHLVALRPMRIGKDICDFPTE
jgi:hypothetical protein